MRPTHLKKKKDTAKMVIYMVAERAKCAANWEGISLTTRAANTQYKATKYQMYFNILILCALYLQHVSVFDCIVSICSTCVVKLMKMLSWFAGGFSVATCWALSATINVGLKAISSKLKHRMHKLSVRDYNAFPCNSTSKHLTPIQLAYCIKCLSGW